MHEVPSQSCTCREASVVFEQRQGTSCQSAFFAPGSHSQQQAREGYRWELWRNMGVGIAISEVE
jgi:hypothetical protein